MEMKMKWKMCYYRTGVRFFLYLPKKGKTGWESGVHTAEVNKEEECPGGQESGTKQRNGAKCQCYDQ